MKTFWLLRHGELKKPRGLRCYGRLPFPLTVTGRNQIKGVAAFLQDKEITKIYSSPVLRCRQSSEIISQSLGLPLEFDKRLAEVLMAIQGISYDLWDKMNLFSGYEVVENLGGESREDVQKRMIYFWEEKISEKQGNILICSHGDPLYLLYLHLVSKEIPSNNLRLNERENYLPHASLLPITVDKKGYNIGEIAAIA